MGEEGGKKRPTIHVVGLGPAGADMITPQTARLLECGLPLYLRTSRHPAAEELAVRGVAFETLDRFYDEEEDCSKVYAGMEEYLAERARERGEVVYAVPGSPLVAEETVSRLARREDLEVRAYPAVSFLDALFTALRADPVGGMLLADAAEVAYRGVLRLEPRQPLVLMQVDSRMLASDLKLSLMEIYPPRHPVLVCSELGGAGQSVEEVILCELDHQERFGHLTTLYLEPVPEEGLYDLKRLMEITGILLGPEGCPWDRRQTHDSLARHLVEESYEAVEAVRRGDLEHLSEELGDILLQVALHSQMAHNENAFTVDDCLRHICEKLIRRHPHVFGTVSAETPEEVIANWERIKTGEGGHASLLDGVAEDLPALLFAYKLQTRAARVGFDWGAAEDVLPKLEEELEEVKAAARDRQQKGEGELELELGDLLFSIVNLCRHLGVDPEVALGRSARKFRRRFRLMEEICRREGLELGEVGLEELDRLWDRCKE